MDFEQENNLDRHVESINQTCSACPAQWEVKLKNGKMIYIRFRWGCLSIRVSENKTEDIGDAVNGEEILGEELSDGYDGYLPWSTMLKFLDKALEKIPYKKELDWFEQTLLESGKIATCKPDNK